MAASRISRWRRSTLRSVVRRFQFRHLPNCTRRTSSNSILYGLVPSPTTRRSPVNLEHTCSSRNHRGGDEPLPDHSGGDLSITDVVTSTRRRRGREAPGHQRRAGHRIVHAAGERPGGRDRRGPDQGRAHHHRFGRVDLRTIFDGLSAVDREGPLEKMFWATSSVASSTGSASAGRSTSRAAEDVRAPTTGGRRPTKGGNTVADRSAPWPTPGQPRTFRRSSRSTVARSRRAEDHRRVRSPEAPGDRGSSEVRARNGHGHANALVGWTLAGNTAAP